MSTTETTARSLSLAAFEELVREGNPVAVAVLNDDTRLTAIADEACKTGQFAGTRDEAMAYLHSLRQVQDTKTPEAPDLELLERKAKAGDPAVLRMLRDERQRAELMHAIWDGQDDVRDEFGDDLEVFSAWLRSLDPEHHKLRSKE